MSPVHVTFGRAGQGRRQGRFLRTYKRRCDLSFLPVTAAAEFYFCAPDLEFKLIYSLALASAGLLIEARIRRGGVPERGRKRDSLDYR